MHFTIDEQTAFAPPKRPLPPAETSAEASSRWQEKAEAVLTPLGYTVSVLGESQQRLVPPDPTQAAVIVEHGLLPVANDGRVAWSYFTRETAGTEDQAAKARPLIVHCAGNAGDRYNSGLGYASKALPWGDVLVFDYPGYGDSTGNPSTSALEAASSALIADLSARSEGRDLILWGHSLGGFICARLAEQADGVDGLILETSARSVTEVAAAWKPWWTGPFLRIDVAESLAGYDTASSAKAFGGPVLVLGARKDDTLPVRLARSLADGAKVLGANVRYVEFVQAGHRTVPDAPDFAAQIDGFLLPILND
jgi:pimeloyl-ACP methyl ester carboxylesterase